jgi:hypothetical protein
MPLECRSKVPYANRCALNKLWREESRGRSKRLHSRVDKTMDDLYNREKQSDEA